MARAKFLCDAERCIECNACVTACKNEHEVPWGINRRRVVTIQDGKPGERSISVPRLQRLAGFYDVPVDQLLPTEDNAEIIDLTDRALARQAEPQLVLDLQMLGEMGGAEGAMLNRYVRTIQIQRQDFNGRMLTIRRDDARAIACILGVSTERTMDRLDQLGLCSASA